VALVDELTALQTARPKPGGTPCRLARVLGSMSPEERAALEHLMDRTTVQAPQIAAALGRNGYDVNASQIGHHRRRLRGGGCSCPRPDEVA
jgi:hypothetical protein